MIRSTFAGFTTGQLALAASQRALDVTGQNIANINTEGYTRQRLDIASLNVQRGDFYNGKANIKVGFGVEMTALSQIRDPFLDIQYRTQMAKMGTTDAQAAGMEQLEGIFDESSKTGVMIALNNINSSLQNLSMQVGNQEHDTMVRSNMQVLLNLFHDNSSKLQEIRKDAQTGFETTDVADLNKALENITELNRNIKTAQVLGNPALELQDERNLLLDELSSYLPIDVNYVKKQIGEGQFVQILKVDFTDTDGRTYRLIDDERRARFDTDITGAPVTLSVTDVNGANATDISDKLGAGTLKGTLDYLNKSGEMDGTDFRGIGYYEKALDSIVAKFAETFNDANTDVDGHKKPLFETKDGSTTFTAENIKIAADWLNGTYGITNSTIKVAGAVGTTANDNILSMIKKLETSFDFQYKRPDGTTATFFKGDFYSSFANLQTTLAVDKKSAELTLKNQVTVLNQTADSRDNISGVQLDEEGMNLMHYNQSYSAAARFVTALDEALDKLINGTGVVGR